MLRFTTWVAGRCMVEGHSTQHHATACAYSSDLILIANCLQPCHPLQYAP